MQVKPVESKAKFAVLSSNNRKISVTQLSPWSKNESFLVRINNQDFEIKRQGRQRRKRQRGNKTKTRRPAGYLATGRRAIRLS
jgi:hypothetical protein